VVRIGEKRDSARSVIRGQAPCGAGARVC